jgi:hypothetical protein
MFILLQLVSWLVAWGSAENSDDMEEGESITHSLPAPYSSNPPPPPPSSYSNPPPPPPPSYSSPSSQPYSYPPAFAQRAGIYIVQYMQLPTLQRKFQLCIPFLEIVRPNFHISVSVSDLGIFPRIGSHISCSRIGRPIMEI